jgi:hypothetical protein
VIVSTDGAIKRTGISQKLIFIQALMHFGNDQLHTQTFQKWAVAG